MADPVTMGRLKAIAAERGVSLATVVREALEAKADEYLPRQTWIGMLDSGAPRNVAGTLGVERIPVEDR
jgi:hypothetical protein